MATTMDRYDPDVAVHHQQVLPILDRQSLQHRQNDATDMDPLEWTIRKLLPLPNAYYWETGSCNISLHIKAWHRVVATFGTMVQWMDRMGPPIARALGLTTSQYSYVMAYMTEDDWRRARQSAQQRIAHQQRQHSTNESLEGEDLEMSPLNEQHHPL